MKTKKILILLITAGIFFLFGCIEQSTEITVVSREDGSGTRGAFIELFKIEERDSSGNRVDRTTKEAVISNRTDAMISLVAGNTGAIGYVSLGSLNTTVKALAIDGTMPSVTNIQSNDYKIARPFNIATKGAPSDLAQDFINFIFSKEGQEVVSENYIPVKTDTSHFNSNNSEGRIIIAGSSSVTPLMEKLREAYLIINPVTIEIQQSDSSIGLRAAIDGICDIAMASRELRDSEKSVLEHVVIGIDGIAVIVNNRNELTNMTSEQVKNVFTGEITSWDDF